MHIPKGYDSAAAYDGAFETLPPGGYVCEIMSAREETANVRGRQAPKFVIAFDICEGEYKGYFKRQHDRARLNSGAALWRGVYETFVETQDGVCSPFFKGLIKVIEQSNPGFAWGWDERTLAGKKVGIVFGEERYTGNDGNPHTAVRARFARTVEMVREGVEPPPLRDRTQNAAPGAGYVQQGYAQNGFTVSTTGAGRATVGNTNPPATTVDTDDLPF